MIADDGLVVSDDRSRLDVPLIHRFLSEVSTWAPGIPLETVRRGIENSLCFGAYVDGGQVAFARVISDYATFANLVDVFVLPEHRGRGYAGAIMQAVIDHPHLQGLRRFTLVTANAHGLYARYGFRPIGSPEGFMERFTPDTYR